MVLDRGWKPSREQRQYRREEVARLWKSDGRYSAEQIAKILDPAVGAPTVRGDLAALGIARTKRYSSREPLPDRVSWLDPPPRLPPAHARDKVARAAEAFLASVTGIRAVSAHANDLADARRRGDTGFEVYWVDLLSRLRGVADALSELHTDTTGEAMRGAILGWAEEGTAGHDRAVARAHAVDPDLAEEIWRCLARRIPVRRADLARKYGLSANTVQREARTAALKKQLLEQGWRPPPGP